MMIQGMKLFAVSYFLYTRNTRHGMPFIKPSQGFLAGAWPCLNCGVTQRGFFLNQRSDTLTNRIIDLPISK